MESQFDSDTTTPTADSYIFRLLKFRITNTRALDDDTDHVGFTVQIDGDDTQPPQIRHTGDVDNGDHLINLSSNRLQIDPSTTVTLTYQIVNSGHDNQAAIEQALTDALHELAKDILPSSWQAALRDGRRRACRAMRRRRLWRSRRTRARRRR